MLELIVGIVLGAAFHDFWKELFLKSKNKVNQWMSSGSPKNSDAKGDVVEGEIVDSPKDKEAPAN